MRPLILEKINNKLDEIVTKCFEGNRIADRGMSVLGVKFVMNKTESVLHPKVAHLFPALADKVSEYQGSRNNLTFYGLTPADNTDYDSPLDFFERLLNHMIDLEGLIMESVDLSKDEKDYSTQSFLFEFLESITELTAQCLLLIDKAELYKNDWMAFDHRIEDFIIL